MMGTRYTLTCHGVFLFTINLGITGKRQLVYWLIIVRKFNLIFSYAEMKIFDMFWIPMSMHSTASGNILLLTSFSQPID